MKTYTKSTTFMSVSEVSLAFGVSEGTVREWAKTEALPAKKIGKQWYFPKGSVLNVQSMGHALDILGDKAEPSHQMMFDILLDNTRVEVKSSNLRKNPKHGEYWKFSNIHSPEQSDYYLLIGYNENRSDIIDTFYIPTSELFLKLPELVTKGDGLTKNREFTHKLEGKRFIVKRNDGFFQKYLLPKIIS